MAKQFYGLIKLFHNAGIADIAVRQHAAAGILRRQVGFTTLLVGNAMPIVGNIY